MSKSSVATITIEVFRPEHITLSDAVENITAQLESDGVVWLAASAEFASLTNRPVFQRGTGQRLRRVQR